MSIDRAARQHYDEMERRQQDDGFTCPRCGGGIPNDAMRGEYPGALSRADNRTEVCSQCGTDEAMEVFLSADHTCTPVSAWPVANNSIREV